MSDFGTVRIPSAINRRLEAWIAAQVIKPSKAAVVTAALEAFIAAHPWTGPEASASAVLYQAGKVARDAK